MAKSRRLIIETETFYFRKLEESYSGDYLRLLYRSEVLSAKRLMDSL